VLGWYLKIDYDSRKERKSTWDTDCLSCGQSLNSNFMSLDFDTHVNYAERKIALGITPMTMQPVQGISLKRTRKSNFTPVD
jgi:hypothetical protein